jgi:hypothetical protein
VTGGGAGGGVRAASNGRARRRRASVGWRASRGEGGGTGRRWWCVGRGGFRLLGCLLRAQPVNSATSDLFKKNQTNLNLIRSKDGLPKLNFFEIKYGIEGN